MNVREFFGWLLRRKRQPPDTGWGYAIHTADGDAAYCDVCLDASGPRRTALDSLIANIGNQHVQRLRRGDGDLPCQWCGRSAST